MLWTSDIMASVASVCSHLFNVYGFQSCTYMLTEYGCVDGFLAHLDVRERHIHVTTLLMVWHHLVHLAIPSWSSGCCAQRTLLGQNYGTGQRACCCARLEKIMIRLVLEGDVKPSAFHEPLILVPILLDRGSSFRSSWAARPWLMSMEQHRFGGEEAKRRQINRLAKINKGICCINSINQVNNFIGY